MRLKGVKAEDTSWTEINYLIAEGTNHTCNLFLPQIFFNEDAGTAQFYTVGVLGLHGCVHVWLSSG